MLENNELFSGLEKSELQRIEKYATTRSYKKNTLVIDKGDDSTSMYIVLEGKLKTFISEENGKEIILNHLEQGEYFGEMALLTGRVRCASVMTTEDARLLRISRADFLECLSKNPDVSLNIIRGLIERIEFLTEKVSDLGLKDVYMRVANLLKKRVSHNDGSQTTERLTQQDIANEVGATREMISRIFKDLKTGGYITIEDGCITLNKPLPAKW